MRALDALKGIVVSTLAAREYVVRSLSHLPAAGCALSLFLLLRVQRVFNATIHGFT